MTLPTHEFIRRFLTHVLPKGLHRIRHYGLFANGNRAANIARARELLAVPSRAKQPETSATAAALSPDSRSTPNSRRGYLSNCRAFRIAARAALILAISSWPFRFRSGW
jgi:hypothetical protein